MLHTLLRQSRIPFERVHNSAEILLHCPACVGQGQHVQYGRLYFNTQKGVGLCQRCGWKGKEQTLLTLLGVRSVPTLTFPDDPPPKRETPISPFPYEAIPAIEDTEAMTYVRSRGLTEKHIHKFGLFYCREGFYARRLVIPVLDRQGAYRTFQTRTIDKTEPKKYLSAPGGKLSHLLYNLHFIGRRSYAWLVEGIFDSIHCFPYGVATFGKKISSEQINLLRLSGVTQVFLLFDAEAWQKTPKEWNKTVRALCQHFFTVEVKLSEDTVTEYSVQELHAMCRAAL